MQLQKSLTDDEAKLKGMTDPALSGTFALDSLRTAVEITLNCVSKEPNMRPSVDDVLWHLQYSNASPGWMGQQRQPQYRILALEVHVLQFFSAILVSV